MPCNKGTVRRAPPRLRAGRRAACPCCACKNSASKPGTPLGNDREATAMWRDRCEARGECTLDTPAPRTPTTELLVTALCTPSRPSLTWIGGALFGIGWHQHIQHMLLVDGHAQAGSEETHLTGEKSQRTKKYTCRRICEIMHVHTNITAVHAPAYCEHKRFVPLSGCLLRRSREGQI